MKKIVVVVVVHTAYINIPTICVYSRCLVFLPQRQIDGSVGTKTEANIRHGHRHFYKWGQGQGGEGHGVKII